MSWKFLHRKRNATKPPCILKQHTHTHTHSHTRTNTPAGSNGLIDAEPGKSGAALSCFCSRLADEWKYSLIEHLEGPTASFQAEWEVREALYFYLNLRMEERWCSWWMHLKVAISIRQYQPDISFINTKVKVAVSLSSISIRLPFFTVAVSTKWNPLSPGSAKMMQWR